MSKALFIESLRRSYRNWQRKRNRILPTEAPPPFFYARDINAVKEYFSGIAAKQPTSPPELANSYQGHCFVCRKDVLFKVVIPADGSPVSWRETLQCPHCDLINRWRSCLHVFEAICEPTANDRIYLTETLSPIYQNLAGRFPLLRSSEYFPDKEFGEMVQTHVKPVRNEDVTRLSFSDASMDIILSFDVLEHVADYRSALREFYRVLGSGGQLVVSVPFSDRHETRVRARMHENGHIEHLVEPCYHGDPLSDQGVLSFYDFGMELLDEMRAAGFQECFVLCYHSRKWAYLNENVVFIARKLKVTESRARLIRLARKSFSEQLSLISERSAELTRRAMLSVQKRVSRPQQWPLPPGEQVEQSFDTTDVVNQAMLELPEIFHYWSNKFLVPEMSRFGFDNPEDFFFLNTKKFMKGPGRNHGIKILSIGSGECGFEIRITEKLLQWQLTGFVIECLDVNEDKLEKGRRAVEAAGLADYFLFTQGDLNHWRPYRKYEIAYANQSLHDVVNLGGLFDSVNRALKPAGWFIISDMIGRNAGKYWPETLDASEPFWNELPRTYRYNRMLNRQEERFNNAGAPDKCIEVNRSQEILPLLHARFNFRFFFPYGNMIFMFIDRSFGHNFDADADWDKDFIDRVHARDEAGLISGELKPGSMLAVLTKQETASVLRHEALTPEKCIRVVSVNDVSDVGRVR